MVLPWDGPPRSQECGAFGEGKTPNALINVMSCICSLGLGHFQPSSTPCLPLPPPHIPVANSFGYPCPQKAKGKSPLGIKTMTAVLRASWLREHPGSRLEQGLGAGDLPIPLEKRKNHPGSLLQEPGEEIPTWKTQWAGGVWSSIAGCCSSMPSSAGTSDPPGPSPYETTRTNLSILLLLSSAALSVLRECS